MIQIIKQYYYLLKLVRQQDWLALQINIASKKDGNGKKVNKHN